MNKLIAAFLSKILAPFINIGPPKEWTASLPNNLMPNIEQCNKLEKLRVRHRIPNDIFAELFISSSATTRKVQENVYSDAKKQMSNASEKELLDAVFRSRVFPQHPCGLKMNEQEIQETMKNINSLNDLKAYFVKIDEKEFPFPGGIVGIGKKLNQKISDILEN